MTAPTLPAIALDGDELADLERIAAGAAPGFLGEADYRAVLATGRLADGTPCPSPAVLAIEARRVPSLRAAGAAALVDAAGRPLAVLRIADLFERDPIEEARAVHGTDDARHPGVARVLARPRWLAGGRVELLPRAAAAPRPGFIVWFTGMSGAGKSTLSAALARHLAGAVPLEVLDGDEVRTHLSRGLGFSRADRDTNVQRIAFVARTLARHGVGVVTAAISPYADTRRDVRARAEAEGLAFVEVYARAELGALVARDVKGLYRRALAGEVPHFTGVSAPYEPPDAPEVEVRTDREPVATSLARIVDALVARGLVPSAAAIADAPAPAPAADAAAPVARRAGGRP